VDRLFCNSGIFACMGGGRGGRILQNGNGFFGAHPG
jgi:hypothetical protein